MPGAPYTLDPCYVNEDVEIVVAVEGAGSLAAWGLSFEVWRPTGAVVAGGLTVGVPDPLVREISAKAVGVVVAPGVYPWVVRRTDVGSRCVVALGVLVVSEVR